MRTFIQDLSAYARANKPGFLIVSQDGLPDDNAHGDSTGTPDTAYFNAIDGVGQEEVYYGYNNVDDATTLGRRSQCVFADVAVCRTKKASPHWLPIIVTLLQK